MHQFYKNLFTKRIFFAGHLTAVCDHTFGFNYTYDETKKCLLLNKICEQIIKKAKNLHAKATIIKEIPKMDLLLFKKSLKNKFVFVSSLPNAILTLDHNKSYIKQIRTRYRKLLRKRIKQFNDTGLTWEIQNSCDEFAEIIDKMYLQTLFNAEYKFEHLNANYFNNISKQVSNTLFIFAKKQDSIVGFGLISVEKNSLQTLYLGYDEQYKNTIYFNMFYKLIDEAFIRKKKYLLLGQTSYEFKQSLGACLHDVYLGFHSHNKTIYFKL